MNEKQFLKEINKKYNSTGTCTFTLVKELIEQENEKSLQREQTGFMKIFNRIFKRNRREKTSSQIIGDNIGKILRHTHCYSVEGLLIFLLKDKKTRNIVYNHFHEILANFDGIREDFFDDNDLTSKINFLRTLKLTPSGKDVVKRNINKILEYTTEDDLFETIQILKGFGENTDSKLNEFLNSNKRKIAKSLIKRLRNVHIDKKLLEDYTDTLLIMIEELLASEGKDFIDIERIGEGAYSKVYQIGSKVLKIGEPRRTYDIPNHRRILQPLIRTNFLDRYGKKFACVEISDKVRSFHSSDENELYEIYKELRDSGIIWTDVRDDNVGILDKKNIPNLNGENWNVAPNSVGFVSNVETEPLDIGDLVIIDTDYIFCEAKGEVKWLNNRITEKLLKKFGN